MTIITLRDGMRFDAEASETILDAALRAGVALEYSCRNGRCGTCVCTVLSGSTALHGVEYSLAGQDGDEILTCVRTALTDVSLDLEDISYLGLPRPRFFPAKISEIEPLNDDVMRVALRTPPSQPMPFKPGQYVTVTDKHQTKRSYSIANAPRAEGLIDIHVKRVANGEMSRYWFEAAKVNDLLRIDGPLGTFALRPYAAQSIIFVATGVGIAPVKAMLEGIAANGDLPPPKSVLVIWGCRDVDDLYWDPRTTGVDLQFVPILSRAGQRWSGRRGWVQDVLADAIGEQNQSVYACGSPTMIDAVRLMTLVDSELGNSFYADAFVTSAP